MEWLGIMLLLIIGVAVGIALTHFFLRHHETRQEQRLQVILENLKASFGNLSLEALSRSTEEFLKLAKNTLESERNAHAKEMDSKKGLIDQQLEKMGRELENLAELMQSLEKDRVEKFGELANQLKHANDQSTALLQLTGKLHEVLASSKARGQWGQRMAEDVLRMAGFVEDVNYLKERVIEGTKFRPDFTFLLPKGLKLNMDVKFPLDNYVNYLDATSDVEREKYRGEFLRDVKARIKEVKGREYINQQQQTLDYMLLFIPNEQIYAFIHEQDSSILETGLKNKVVLCSPLTLFAVLAVIRQAVDNFALEKTSNEILLLLGNFKKQWTLFLGKLELLGKRIGDTQKEFEALNTTRRRQLEKPLNRLEELRTTRNLQEHEGTEPRELPSANVDAAPDKRKDGAEL